VAGTSLPTDSRILQGDFLPRARFARFAAASGRVEGTRKEALCISPYRITFARVAISNSATVRASRSIVRLRCESCILPAC
jgi:hypothetical protein